MKIKQAILTFLREDDGLTTVEYAIAGSLVGAAVIVAFSDLGDAVCNVINGIKDTIEAGSPNTATAGC